MIFGISFYQFIELNEKNKIFLWNYYLISFSLCGSAPNSQSFQSSIKSIVSHTAIHIKLLTTGLFGKTYISSKFHNHLQIITIEIQTRKIFRFEVRSFLKFFTFFNTWFVFFHILFLNLNYCNNYTQKFLKCKKLQRKFWITYRHFLIIQHIIQWTIIDCWNYHICSKFSCLESSAIVFGFLDEIIIYFLSFSVWCWMYEI